MVDPIGLKDAALADASILIPAAGLGNRLGMGSKAFLELKGRALVSWLGLKALRVAAEVIVAVPPGDLERLAVLCPGCRGIEGGESRQDTVSRLVAEATKPWVLVQDAARPFVTEGLMRAVLEAARESKAAGAFLQPDVPVARIRDGLVVEDFQRGQIGIFQAPQAFERTLLAKVLAEADARGWKEQSTIQLVLRTGIPVRAIPGEKTNIKLTTEEDWRLAQSLIEWLV